MKIIRTRQRPILVVIDVILTVVAWVGLLLLLMRGLWPLLETHAGAPRIDSSAFDALGTLQIYLWIAVVNAVILIAWARYQQRKSRSFAQRRLPSPVIDDAGLSKSFKLCDDSLQKLRTPGVMTIHNDQEGDISHVVTHFWPMTQAQLPSPLAPLEHPRVIFLHAEDDDNREPLTR
ncbi:MULTISPECIES: poly-beta-1,6-N-acetyl-D-glucosamine biosynthesis protein PgaD [Pseudomonas]|jgi:biofilm PGA synthesis protein PgaD|uniref:Biofilm PGA synthesis protein PgaD n=3 Tax=Pseudomonas TaxID=286 RepID=A0A370SZ83_PSEJE|nr:MULTISPECIES: poly-beta-1,6-N-acetyl-D-glucosamine biosynthesis protein PgaD [Pseudomonas]MBA4272413.1 poly-beta-1,6-N-acetyl-D-glucosamine biosynthesis protein PgaD [Pseudomonas sp.]MBK3466648.1 poly-beta-1,6-N-acetyl-D-glucosamine biosynthesis protein PgaD [Pseudomonas sp. MF6776]MCT8950486.1 poly-beta-1,6-N-acetyl-D-glucosamine biosynthesis protein PgaD [Pseudomonas iridis]MDD1010732.1 poly-beta-1,6-N-acetyl-D-glucosamine biosynthesis protein PgaD [Pseudomonas shahriarae]RDL25045.1 biofi